MKKGMVDGKLNRMNCDKNEKKELLKQTKKADENKRCN